MQPDDFKKKSKLITDGDDSEEGSTSGGASGEIEFREFIGGTPLRDDLMSDLERRRLFSVHEGAHEGAVEKQKEMREQIKQVKEGKMSLSNYRQGLSGGGDAGYKTHPALEKMSGVDRQVNPNPNENNPETNDEKRNELRYQHQHKPGQAPPQLRRS